MSNAATLIARPHPFCQRPAIAQVRAGRTLRQILDEAMDGAPLPATLRVDVNGIEVPRAWWGRLKPKPGTQIHCTVMPAGGGGNKILRAVLMVVIIVVAWYVAPLILAAMPGLAAAGVTSAMIASGLTMLGTMALNALVPPPKPKMESSQGAPERQFALTGTQNNANPYGVVPLVIGEMRFFPTHAAFPYTEEAGADKYLRMMLDLGHGDIDVSDIRIGETPIDSYEGVEYEVTRTPTLYTDDIYEDPVGATLNDGDVITRTTQPQADEIGVVIDFQGLYGADKKGKIKQATAPITFEYRAMGSGTWLTSPITAGRRQNWNAGNVKTSNRNPFTVAVWWPVPKGQYEVRISRGTTLWDGALEGQRTGDATVGALRTLKKTNPSTTGTTKLALRIKATDQLNGTVQTLNCVVRQRIPVWNGTAWVEEYSRNPAWVMHWLVRHCPAVAIRASADMVDLPAIIAFADYCEARELECSSVVDASATLLDLVGDVLAAGMGARAFRDGKISVVFDDPDAIPVGMFTPANYVKFSGQRTFFEMAHGLRVKFVNPDAGYITDEIIVLDDGYSYRGLDARGNPSALPEATRFEQLDLKAARGAQAAWRAGRQQLGQARYRPAIYQMETDIEMIRHTRGDLVTVMDDVVEWGEGWGRIVAIDAAENRVRLDETSKELPAGSYYLQFRTSDGAMHSRACVPHAPVTDTFVCPDGLPAGLAYGDVAIVGSATRQARDLLVTGITPGDSLSAVIRLVDHAPALYDYVDNPPEAILSEATGLSYREPPAPPRITVVITNGLVSDPGDAGTTSPEGVVGIRGGSGYSRLPPWRQAFEAVRASA
ncbi:host specificity factor TipJ family phage tail protein [Pseudoxanthomonas sp. LjRoot143]|uniref:host specificity factor TipJ family phage tail protein n=1 Tax=Pseudoxanthomonas sp. LjRoot143 TaxID=3342266 RepID=UPI003ECCC309